MSRSHGRSPPLGAAKASGFVPWNGTRAAEERHAGVRVRRGEADHPRLGRQHGIGPGGAEVRRAHHAHRADPRLAGDRHRLLHRPIRRVVAEPVVAVDHRHRRRLPGDAELRPRIDPPAPRARPHSAAPAARRGCRPRSARRASSPGPPTPPKPRSPPRPPAPPPGGAQAREQELGSAATSDSALRR